MKMVTFTLIALAATVATAQPSIARDSQDATAPVSVLACDVFIQYVSPEDVGATIYADKTVTIAFVNRATKTIRDVTFRVDANVDGGVRTISDIGTFSAGVPIHHTYGPFGDVNFDARCDVAAVTFEDGTVWEGSPRSNPSADFLRQPSVSRSATQPLLRRGFLASWFESVQQRLHGMLSEE